MKRQFASLACLCLLPLAAEDISKRRPGAETRWAGGNYSGYNNPVMDRAIEQLERSVRTDERAMQLAEIWRIVTEDAGAVGLYIRPVPYMVRKGIRGPIPSSLSGSVTSNVQSWEAS